MHLEHPEKSPSLLIDVIEGRRNLTDAAACAFCTAMVLRRDQATFFRAMVQFAQAANTERKQEA